MTTTRADMAESLSLDASAPTKTFVLEVHTDDAERYVNDLAVGAVLQPTDDAYLYQILIGEARSFWVDQLDPRFWLFHTDMQVADAHGFLRDRVEHRRDLDWMWLPSNHVRRAWPESSPREVRARFEGHNFLTDVTAAQDLRIQLAGRNADELLDLIARDDRYRSAVSFDSVQSVIVDPQYGSITEGLNRMGRFAAYGESFELHLALVQRVVSRYRTFVELCETRAYAARSLPDGGVSHSGGPIVLRFSRPIDDLGRFVSELLAVRRPFRLWGEPMINGDMASVEAVDLHVGQRLGIDIGRDWLRVYLDDGACGNTVARLVSNLQHHYDSALTLQDPHLAESALVA